MEVEVLNFVFLSLQFLCSFGSGLCKQDPNMEQVPIKLLILILNLVDEFQIVRKKLTCYNEATSETESDMKNILDYESSLVTLFGEKSTKLFLLLLVNVNAPLFFFLNIFLHNNNIK